MKKTLILLILILVGGGWTANKYLQRANKSSEEKERFIEQARNYTRDARIYLSEQADQHHDEAFAASYRMWKFSPVSEFDLSAHYDEQAYYRTLGKIITEKAKEQGQADAYAALLDIGQYYGVPYERKKPGSNTQAIQPETTGSKTETLEEKKDSMLKKSKLGEKRRIPSSRRRDDDR